MATTGVARARRSTAATFALVGFVFGVWTVRIPALADRLSLGESAVGFTVFAWGIGALTCMQLTRSVLARSGSRTVLRLAAPAVGLGVLLVSVADSYPVLLAFAVLFGMAFGLTDIAMNAQASTVELAMGRPVMNGMHAGWSAGAVLGGLAGAAAAAAGLGFTPTLALAGALSVPVAVLLGRDYLCDPTGTGAGEPVRGRVRLPAAVYLVGALCFIAFLIEGSVADWSGLYLRDALGAGDSLAALGYPAFEVAMLAGRLVGDRASARYGARHLLGAAGVGTAGAFVLVVASGSPWSALLGFALVGAAVCVAVPLTFSLAGTVVPQRLAGVAIAQVGALGYTGLLLGPVLIGLVAEASDLRVGMAAVAGLALVISAGAVLLRTEAGTGGVRPVSEPTPRALKQ
ncbi:MFS transporter [Allokutzneria oryzae]|uniref:MFS transporter n=1 Tax=Allokutzneria oryzae TaxID=1378989 RepID=A0ABV5ZRD7_9PSEU